MVAAQSYGGSDVVVLFVAMLTVLAFVLVGAAVFGWAGSIAANMYRRRPVLTTDRQAVLASVGLGSVAVFIVGLPGLAVAAVVGFVAAAFFAEDPDGS